MGVFLLAGLYTYNTWGRSGVDGNDQLREMLNMARRRCVRDGTKGMLFLFDITLTNGYIMWKMVREVTKTSLKDSKYWFEDEWVRRVFQLAKGVRVRMPLTVIGAAPLTSYKHRTVVCTTSTQVLAVQAVQHDGHKLFNVLDAVRSGELEYGNHTKASHEQGTYKECKGRCQVCLAAINQGEVGSLGQASTGLWCHHACMGCSKGSKRSSRPQLKWFHQACFAHWPAHQDLEAASYSAI